MKKIAFLMLNPFTYGGEQRVVSVVASLLCESGYEVSIICTQEEKIDYDMYNLNKKVKIINVPECNTLLDKVLRKFCNALKKINTKFGTFSNFPALLEKIYVHPIFKKRLIKKISEEKYNYVIGVASHYSLLLAIIKDKISSKIIGWQHNNYIAYFETKGRRFYHEKKLFQKLCHKFDNYIVLMNDDKKKIKEKFNLDSVHIFNPLSFRNNGKCNLNSHTFISYGRFEFNKGYELLIDSYLEYRKLGGTWKLILVGDGPERENIIKRIDDNNLSKFIEINGFTSHIENYLEKSSAFLFPSRWEGFGLTLTESMQYGLPSVCYDLNPFIEITNGFNSCILVPQFDIKQFAKAMLKLENDPKLLKEMSEEAYRNTKVLEDKEIIRKWKSVLK